MDKKKLAEDITRALGYTENGGKPTKPKAGKTGELKSIFQFEPRTWNEYSKEVFGKVVPLDNDTETHVVLSKVGKWLDEGKNPQQIASMWNAGPSEPDAYTGKFSDGSPSSGVNKKYGVKFSVPDYVKKFDGYLKESGKNAGAEKKQVDPKVASDYKKNVDKLMSIVQQAKANSTQANTAPQPGVSKGLIESPQTSIVS